MTATDERRQYSAVVHNKLRAIFEAAEQQAHDAIQADDNVQARVVDLEAVIERLRKEREIAACECEQHRLYIDQLEAERKDALAAKRAYDRLLTDIRKALGAVDDADLVEEARRVGALTLECRRLQSESADRLEQRRLEWTRAERTESQRDRILARVRAYKAAVDAQSGVPDAQAALFRVLVEMEEAHV